MTDIGFPSPENVIYMNESLTTTRSRVFNAVQERKRYHFCLGMKRVFFEKWENLNSMIP